MFESEDFDLDEDFLEDIGKKEEEYYSQKTDLGTQSDPPAKRQKTESLESDFFSDITFDDEPDFAKSIPKSVETSPKESASECADVTSRKKRILEIFNSNNDSFPSQNVSQQNQKHSLSNQVSQKSPESLLSTKNVETSRKALALEILRKGSLDENQKRVKTPPKSINNRATLFIDKNSHNANHSEEISDKSIAESFKKPAERCSEVSKKLAARNSPKFPSRDRTISAPRLTLVRRFPGPAGLLPDTLESNLDHANFLNGLSDCGIDENLEDSKISDFCSQNTERLFSSGAWRSMLDDLPVNFLKGHEIATIKRLARDSWKKSRVSFVAGVVQRIDQSVDNPRLLLKDMTDSIEATMHSDIPLAYPNILEPGIVILLRDAGLLGYQGSQKCPGHQYHLMISPRNLLAVYSEKTRLVSSPWMESINKTARTLSADDVTDQSANSEKNDGNERKILSERNPVVFDHMEISDFDSEDEDKAFASFNLGDITDSQTSASFSKAGTEISTKSPIGRKLERKEETKDRIFGNEKSPADQNRKEATKIGTKKSPGIDKSIGKIEQKKNEDLRSAEIEIKPKPIVGVRSRLLQFRSNDVLTPPISEDKSAEKSPSNSIIINNSTKENKEDKDDGDVLMGNFGDDLLASDDDTEDEILSQLDVDSIMTNYNAGF